ncbi:MAG: sugar phosphate isomerase/epimerase [Phycisphaeraceae bacterium]|nr:sugar phosphate isomerase/epimerase [Phycisphaeraceae bacterium]
MTTTIHSRMALCSWSTKSNTPQELVESVKQTGLSNIQLALMPLIQDAAVWGDTPKLLADAGINVISGMFGCDGEDYTTLESIRATGGMILDHTWETNFANVQLVAKVAQSMGLSSVSSHAGFLPESKDDPNFDKLASRLTQVASCFADHGLTLIFESGQETAATLNQFLDELASRGATNVGINFDPANMLMYNMGDPVASAIVVGPRIKQVHIKDGVRAQVPGTWGKEVAVGAGQVDWPAFIKALKQVNYTGSLVIEREAGDQRLADIQTAAEHISSLLG